MQVHTPPQNNLYNNAFEKYVLFFLVFMGILALSYGFLVVIDFLPEKPKSESTLIDEITKVAEITTGTEVSMNGEIPSALPAMPVVEVDPLPVKIIFDTLGREVKVLNPESRSINALDTALLSGVVRHPDSGDFARVGTMLLFGHSSYLPNVVNKNFQSFNGIQNLKWGDTVRLQSRDTEYVYQVTRVYETSASDESEIPIHAGKEELTLVTCDSFGAKTDRFVVETALVSKKAL